MHLVLHELTVYSIMLYKQNKQIWKCHMYYFKDIPSKNIFDYHVTKIKCNIRWAMYNVLQRQKAVTSYLKSKQLLSFSFTR